MYKRQQRTFFHSPGANRLLDLPAFEPLDAPLKIFHLGYLLLLESLDRPDDCLLYTSRFSSSGAIAAAWGCSACLREKASSRWVRRCV